MRMSECHKKLTNGVGRCSVPMWSGGCPSGFCDNEAFGERPPAKSYWHNAYTNEQIRDDLKYNGYVPALACVGHGGPKKEEALHLCIFCENEFPTCKSNPKFGCGYGNDNIYECDAYKLVDDKVLNEDGTQK